MYDPPSPTPKKIRKFIPDILETSSYNSKVKTQQESAAFSHAKKRLQVAEPDCPSNTDTCLDHFVTENNSEDRTDSVFLSHFPEIGDTKDQFKPSGPSRDPKDKENGRKFQLQVVETNVLRRSARFTPISIINNAMLQKQSSPRKFTPQLVETDKRSFRRLNSSPSQYNLPEPGCDGGSQISIDSACLSLSNDTLPNESKFSYSILRQRQENRKHSFRIPDLPAIPSSGSDASDEVDMPSFSTSLPVPSDEVDKRVKAEKNEREYCNDNLNDYLFSLTRRDVESQLKEQALAAFPNEQTHEPVDHFAIDKEDDDNMGEATDASIHTIRRESSTDLSWELEQLRRHKEDAEMRDRAMVGMKGKRSSVARLNSGQKSEIDHALGPMGYWRVYQESTLPKYHSRPPMLGNDLIFPQSLSPKTTMCENSPMIDINCDTRYQLYGKTGLWYTKNTIERDCATAGLWMGTCWANTYIQESRGRLPPRTTQFTRGLTDVRSDAWNSEGSTSASPGNGTNPQAARRLRGDHSDRYFEPQDTFVTQIYNYLSLGYPSVARYYDHELSRVSGISVEELRRDDDRKHARGHVDIIESLSSNQGAVSYTCIRWVALRLYILDWAMLQPQVTDVDNDHDAWGVRERRGSWAI